MKSDEQLLEEIERAVEGLFFMSESDHPFRSVLWSGEVEVTPQYLRGLERQASDVPVEMVSVDDFFRAAVAEPDWKGEPEIALAKRYQSLVRLLKEHLSDLAAYRIGRVDIAIYIVGRNKTGNWMGVSTRVVET